MNVRFQKRREDSKCTKKEYIVSYEGHITILADLKVRECNKNEMLNMWTLSLTTGFDTGDKVTQVQNIMPVYSSPNICCHIFKPQ